MKTIDTTVRWRHKLHVRQTGLDDTWRRRIGAWIRALAERIDHQQCMVVHMESDPPLDEGVHEQLLRDAFETLDSKFEEEVKQRAIGLEIEKALPQGQAGDKA